MNILTKSVLTLLVGATIARAAENLAQTVAVTDGVELLVSYMTVYPSSRDVTITYSIINNSDRQIKRFQADETLDLSIQLTSPSGKTIVRYVDQEGAVVQKYQLKRLFVEDIPPSGKSHGSINLAMHYPFTEEGIYSCLLGRKVYHEDPATVRTVALDPPGRPFDLVTKPFQFSIQTIDRTFKPPLSQIEILKSPSTPDQTSGEPSASVPDRGTVLNFPSSAIETEKAPGPWSAGKLPSGLLAVLLIAAIAGLLWVVIKKRR